MKWIHNLDESDVASLFCVAVTIAVILMAWSVS